MPTLVALLAGTGTYLLYTALALGQRGFHSQRSGAPTAAQRISEWLHQAGVPEGERRTLLLTIGAASMAGGVGGWVLYGGAVVPVATAAFTASFPVASVRHRRAVRRARAAEAWPRMIQEIRVLCGAAGRSIPQAVVEVGRRSPAEIRPAFAAAEREWRISTDFERALGVLKHQLADPTADATCETLLIAHGIGGSDVDRRLESLAEDRHADLRGRKDAAAKQAGVRFARRFVLIVPIGMSLAGLSIGDGRSAYATPTGQAGVLVGLAILAACWAWAGRLIRLPEEERVFRG